MSEEFISEMKYLATRFKGTTTSNVDSVLAEFSSSQLSSEFSAEIEDRGYKWTPITARTILIYPLW